MPLPTRYQEAVPEINQIWEAEGYFNAQSRIWIVQVEARHELEGTPTDEGLLVMREALILTPDDFQYLKKPVGHETNRLLRLVQKRLPPEIGNFLHRGNTSRDVLDTSIALQFLASLDMIEEEFNHLQNSLLSLAFQHKETLQIARTHGQHAVPHTFGRQVLGWYAETQRSLNRIQRAREVISFGKCSGEVGTNVFISPQLEELALSKLGLKPEPAPTQLIPRDRHAEAVSLIAVSGMGLARFALNIRSMSRTEIGEVQEPFDEKNQQGSSAMPQKINSELTERINGLSRRIKTTPLEALDTIGVWDEGDMSNSSIERFTFPDLFGCTFYAARLANIVVDGLHIDTERMLSNLELTHGAVYSSRLLNALLETNQLARIEAYDLVKGLAIKALRQQTALYTLARNNGRVMGLINPDQLEKLFDPKFYLRNIDVAYKRLEVRDEAEN